MSLICGIDIGGTFTDCVVIDPGDGSVSIHKTASTPPNFADGLFAALGLAASERRIPVAELTANIALLAHGTTVATNALVERRGARVGLLATAGHGDAPIIMRTVGRVAGLPVADVLRFSAAAKPDPLVPRRLIREVDERIDRDGNVIVELDEEGVELAVRDLVDAGIDCLAIAFLWSFKAPAHEQRAREIARDIAPDLFITCSSELMPVIGEYERTVAAIVNNHVGPETADYLDTVEKQIGGLGGPFLIMQCNGGLTGLGHAKRAPVHLLQSGPVGGVVGSQFLGEAMGYRNIIATDMGGTTFDVGLVVDGELIRTSTTVVNQYEYFVPTVDVKSIGAGGGSIATYDEVTGSLRVGPESAGAYPGPVCYGRGGTRATVTDADLVLGVLDPTYFLGGQLELDVAGALEAVEAVGAPLGLDPYETAAGIVAIADHRMADLIRQRSIERGYDPRDFVVFTYGGAGPVHAAMYARELGARQVVVPLASAASVWSALGVGSSDVIHVYQRSQIIPVPGDPAELVQYRSELQAQALEDLEAEGFAGEDIQLDWSADMRHRSQLHVIEVPFPEGDVDGPAVEALLERFERLYERVFGSGTAFREAGVEVVMLRCTATGRVRKPVLTTEPAEPHEPPAAARGGTRDVYWGELARHEPTAVFFGDELTRGSHVEGPAVIEMPVTTVVARPGDSASVDGYGSIVMNLDTTKEGSAS